MNKETGSLTAIGAAMLRAAHQLIDGDCKLIDDPIIIKLLGAEAKDYITDNVCNFFTPGAMAMRTHVLLRSRYAEDCLAEAYQNGVRQFLILGAGLDTFAYRQPAWAKDMKIIEADHPASQADKIERLEKAGIKIPGNLSFVKVDLETDDFVTVFKKSEFNFNEPVFTTCLGVLIYLTQHAVHKIFDFLGKFVATSQFVFTASQKKEDVSLSAIAEKTALAGEPWITYFEAEKLINQLKTCGFTSASFLTPQELKSAYFAGSRVRLPAPIKNSLVRATIGF